MKKYIITFIVVFALLFSTVGVYAADPNITIVHPSNYSTINTNNLLISVKITEDNKTIELMLSKIENSNNDSTLILQQGPYTSESNLDFYTVEVKDLATGVYRIKVNTLDSSGSAIESTYAFFVVEKKNNVVVFESSKTTWQEFIKGLFGN